MKKIFTNSFCKSNMFALLIFLFILFGSLSLHAQEHHKINIDVELESLRPPLPKFMDYNLGADPMLNTPKKQMAYMADDNNGLTATPTSHGRVFGGRYQWGRANLPYAISTDGNYTLYDGNIDHIILLASITPPPVYDFTTGQIIGQDMNHVYSNTSPNDWCVPQINSLWGNGKAIDVSTISGVFYEENYYQQPVKTVNDPCPPTWRVPTQDEWEILGNYDCDPTHAVANFKVLSSSIEFRSGLTWVRVSCSNNACKTTDKWEASDRDRSGYAIYETVIWNNAAAGYKDGSLDLSDNDAPNPFMFLPTAGFRYNTAGNVADMGSRGLYWSSSINGTNAYFLNFYGTDIYFNGSSNRTRGISIRCVKCGAEPCD